MNRVKYNPNDDNKYWFARDKKRYQEYKADRNKRKIAVKVEEFGMGAAAGAALAAMASVGTVGGAAALGAGGAAAGYGIKKGIRGARALHHRGKAQMLRNLIHNYDRKAWGPWESQDRILYRSDRVTLDDLNGMRFWIQKRRMSSWSYLSRSIIYSLDRFFVSSDPEELRRRFCDAYRLANGELRFLLREVRAFNILLSEMERKWLRKIYSPGNILRALGEDDARAPQGTYRDQLNSCLGQLGKNLREKGSSRGDINIDTRRYNEIIRGLQKFKRDGDEVNGLDLLIFPVEKMKLGVRQPREPGLGWGDEVSTLSLEIVSEIVFESLALLELGGMAGAIGELGVAGAGVGLAFVLAELIISIVAELTNTRMEYGIMKRTHNVFVQCKVPPRALVKFNESQRDLDWFANVDMGWYLEYMRMYVISLRTLLKDAGVFETMIDTYVELFEPDPQRASTDITRLGSLRHNFDMQFNIEVLVEKLAKRVQFLSMAAVYNDYLDSIWTLIKLVNWLHGRSRNPYHNIHMRGLNYSESHLKSVMEWKKITKSSIRNYVTEAKLMSRGAQARPRPSRAICQDCEDGSCIKHQYKRDS